MLEVPLLHIPPDSYRASYFEIRNKRWPGYLREYIYQNVVHGEFDVGTEERQGDLLYRFITLPESTWKGERRVRQIARWGSDRTSVVYQLLHPHNTQESYKKDGQEIKVDPKSWVHLSNLSHTWSGNKNGLLIYDCTTETGMEQMFGSIHTFRRPELRHRALLGIIRLITPQ